VDFFESQERAKRNTSLLVILFAVGVAATVVSVHLLVSATVFRGQLADPRAFLLSAAGVLAVVGIGTAVKFAQMSHGGRAVAEALGGRLIDPGTGDPSERRVLNVVEEMAIASGLRVPPVYLMDDASINAFAAGNSEKDAVIGVTRGCIELLSRDELQGVMAHEFSHVFHRDMRLNMRLVGWLGGIFAVSIVGRILIQSMRGSRPSRGKNDGRAAVAALGVGLFIVGIVGYFFGRLIQAAVSRQREYLADASAVQYTRNPEGIAGALEKIAGAAGSRLSAPAAAEFSHFLFANGIASLFATHPPLAERIRRIRGARASIAAASATPGLPAAASRPAPTAPPMPTPVAGLAAGSAAASAPGRTAGEPPIHAAAVRASRDSMGTLSPESVARAQALLADASSVLVEAARDPFSARAVVCAALLQDRSAARAVQLAAIRASDPKLAAETERLAARGALRPVDRLPLLELAAASLAALSPAQYAAFRTTLAQLIAADGEVDRLEWTVRVLLRHAVEGRSAAPHPSRRATDDDVSLVASVLAWSGARDAPAACRAWSAAAAGDGRLGARPLAPDRCSLDSLDASLRAIAGSGAALRRRTVDACVACVCADGVTTVEEAELLRAVCASIGAPMPVIAAA